MFISQKAIKLAFYAVTAAFAVQSTIEAFPAAYRRLVLKKNGKIVKVIDLVSDYHVPEQGTKPNDLGESEKALVATLKKMGNRTAGQTVEVFGETSPDLLARQFPKDFIDKPLQRLSDRLFSNPNTGLLKIAGNLYQEFNSDYEHKYFPPIPVSLTPILYGLLTKEQDPRLFALKYLGTFACAYAGWQALKGVHHLVSKPKNKKIIYSHGDCYRRNIWDKMDPLGFQKLKSSLGFGQKTIDKPISEKLLTNLDRTIQKDLTKLKRKINPAEYATLQRIWSTSKQTIREESKNGATVPLSSAMDFELLMKIFNSESNHNIICAGANHCQEVSDHLVKHFNFTLIQSTGNDDLKKIDTLKFAIECAENKIKTHSKEWHKRLHAEIRKAMPPLPASTWKHLEALPAGFTAAAA